jgi:hypothetical protein
MDGASRLFCGSTVGEAQHAQQNSSTKTRFKERWAKIRRVGKTNGRANASPVACPPFKIVMR